MNAELQDKAWACLPKEVRDEIKKVAVSNMTALHSFAIIFGNNLTSDTEPEEMLMAKANDVREFYENGQFLKGYKETKPTGELITSWMVKLFGDKCLPDKEPSAQVEPKFRKGDKVIFKRNGDVFTILDLTFENFGQTWAYKIYSEGQGFFSENQFDPYTEPETKDAYEQYQEAKAEEYKNQMKDNMKEKELNLAELLKGCEGETFYSDVFELVVLTKVNLVGNFLTINWNRLDLNLYSNGSKVKGNRCVLWPSKELYEKYPLDAPQAWREWSESRKPKRWRAEKGENYWFFDRTYTPYQQEESGDIEDEIMYDSYNYFRTEEEAQQAAEIIKEALQKFHEQSAK